MSENTHSLSSSAEDAADKDTESSRHGGLWGWFRSLTGSKNGDSALRDTFEELIEEHEERVASIDPGEKALIENILNLGGLTARDVMVPRVDIGAVKLTHRWKTSSALSITRPIPDSRFTARRWTTSLGWSTSRMF